MQNHRRRKPRKTLNQPIAVHDVIEDRRFGELINVTTEGMMIMTDRLVPTQSIYQLAILLPTPLLGHDRVELGVDCLWSRQGEHYNRYWAGFQIIDASDTAIAQLEALIDRFT